MSCLASTRAGGWWSMAIDKIMPAHSRVAWILLAMAAMVCLCGCGTGPLVGLVYTNVKLPLTKDLKSTPMPEYPPSSDRIIEIKEPFTGLGIYTRVSSNALGDIARQNGVDPLYFADQEVFSILGIWKTQRVFLYGETAGGPERNEDGARTRP
jgi:hypothetical protein